MKQILFIFLAICFSCKTKVKQDICIKTINYTSLKKNLTPSVIEIKVEIDNEIILKNIESGKLKNIILYSINKDNRCFFNIKPFSLGKQFKKEGNLLTFYVFTSFFDTERKHKWTLKEIQKAINGDVGLVFEGYTAYLKKCENLDHTLE